MQTAAPSILIVEDEALVATEIELTLRRLGYRIAGSTPNGDEALDLLVNRRPDLALLDINLKGTKNGIDLAQHIRDRHKIPFVFLTAYSDRNTLSAAGQTLPYGYIVKPFNERDLLSTIELALHKHASEKEGDLPSLNKLNGKLANDLTPREYEVLCHLDKGLTYQQVSDELDVSINTVKTYQKSLFAKLGANSRLACLRLVRKLMVLLAVLFCGGLLAQTEAETNPYPEMTEVRDRLNSIRRGPDTALIVRTLDTLLEVAKQYGEDEPLGVYHFELARMQMRRGNYAAARADSHTALEYLQESENYSQISAVHSNLARYYSPTGNYDKVFEHGQASYEAARKTNDKSIQGDGLNTMAIAKRRMKDPEGAIEYFRRSEKLLEDHGRKFNPIVNLAACFGDLGQHDSTIYYYEKSIEIAREQGVTFRPRLALSLTNFSQYYSTNSQPEKALELAREANEIFSEVGNPNQQLASEHAIANAYEKLGQPERALPHLWRARKLVDQIGHLESQVQVYGQMLSSLVKISNNDSINHYLAVYLEYNDSLTVRKRNEAMSEMETRFDVKEKEEEISRLELEEKLSSASLRRQRWIIGLTMAGLVVTGSLLWFVSRQRRRISMQNEIIATSLAEKDTLLKEIHHRVKNNLQIISSLLSLQSNYVEDPTALNALQMGRSRVRSMAIIHQGLYLQDSVTPTIPAKDYLERLTGELLASYAGPETEIELITDFDEVSIDIDRLIPLGLIANELITNSIKYAYQDRSSGQLWVSLKSEHKLTTLRVADNGPGSSQLLTDATDSFGTLLIQTLTKQLQGRLEVDTENGTDVRVIF